MMSTLSLKEAAALAGVPEARVRRAIERDHLIPLSRGAGRGRRYRFRARDLLYLTVLMDSPVPFSPRDKQDLWRLIALRQPRAGAWHREGDRLVVEAPDGEIPVLLDTSRVRRRLVHLLAAYRRGRRRIVSSPSVLGGEPVYEGTRIPLAHIVGMLRKGAPLDEVREDYPSLSEGDVTYAAVLARMRPDPGRPAKRLVLTRDGAAIQTRDHVVRLDATAD